MNDEKPKSHTNPKLQNIFRNPFVVLAVISLVAVTGLLIFRSSQASTPVSINKSLVKPKIQRTVDYKSMIVRFKPGTGITLKNGKFSSSSVNTTEFNNAVFGVYKASSVEQLLPKTQADAATTAAEKKSGKTAPDLDTYYKITFSQKLNTIEVSKYLRKYYFVKNAYPNNYRAIPLATPDYTAYQLYKLAATNSFSTGITANGKEIIASGTYGMNMDSVKNIPGANGSNVTILNIDDGYVKNHEDITKLALPGSLLSYIDTAKGEKYAADPSKDSDTQHGTSTVSITSADKNNFGVTGIVPDAKLLYSYGNYIDAAGNTSVGISRALLAGINRLKAGDVITISMGYTGTSGIDGKEISVPIGYNSDEAAIIRTATQKGIYVLVSAGNSSTDYNNSALFGTGYITKAYGSSGTNDPGHYLIGAASPGAWCSSIMGYGNLAAGSRLPFSSYGSRVSPAAWGACVMSAGNSVYNFSNTAGVLNDDYTFFFNGTSAAAPEVAGLVASFSSAFQEKNKFALSPADLYKKLVETGKAQNTTSGTLSGNIGPIPNAETLFKNAKLFPGQEVTPPPPTPTPPPVVNPPAPTPVPDPPPPADIPPAPSDGEYYMTPGQTYDPGTIISPSEIYPTDGTGGQQYVDTTGNSIENINFSQVSPQEVTVTWQTTQASDTKLLYGSQDKLDKTVTGQGNTTEHSVTIPGSEFQSGQDYSYKVVATANGQTVESEVSTFTAPGYTVNIRIVDESNKPVTGAEITIGDMGQITGEDGVTQFTDLPVGEQKISIVYNKAKQQSTINVQPVTQDVQQYDVKIKKAAAFDWISLALISGGIIIIAAILIFFVSTRKKSPPGL